MKKYLSKKIAAGGLVCCLALSNGMFSYATENNPVIPKQKTEVVQGVSENSAETGAEETVPEIVASYELPGTLFVGDSYISRLDRYGYAAAKGFEVEAIGGDTSTMATQRLVEFGPHTPTCIVMLVGINDCGLLDFDGSHIDTMISYIRQIEAMYPGVPILVQKVFPIAKPAVESTFPGCIPERVERFNQLVADYCAIDDRVSQIDTRDGFIGEDGYMITELATEDGVHLTEDSYQKWIVNIEEAMRKVTKEVTEIHDFSDNLLPMPKEEVAKGAVGDSVKWIEWQLGKAGYPINETGGIKGVYGAELEEMIMEYQEAAGLAITGTADINTIMKLSVEKLNLIPETVSGNNAEESGNIGSVSANQADMQEEGKTVSDNSASEENQSGTVSGNSTDEGMNHKSEPEALDAISRKAAEGNSQTKTESGSALSVAYQPEQSEDTDTAEVSKDPVGEVSEDPAGEMDILQADSKIPVELKKDTVTKWLNIRMGY